MISRNVNLDLIRVFAAGMVLSVHIGQYAGYDFGIGAKGVQLFFVLCGYLSFVSLDKNNNVLLYYKSRAVRILPTYWFCIILLYLTDLLFAVLDGSIMQSLISGQCSWKFLRYILMVHLFTPSDNWNMWNNHSSLWTMSVFAGYYLLAPWFYRCMKNVYSAFLIEAVLLFGTPIFVKHVYNALSHYPEEAYIEGFARMNPIAELYCFLLGAVLYIAIKEEKALIYISIILICVFINLHSEFIYDLLSVIVLYVMVSSNSICSKQNLCKLISYLGKGSFTLYILHPIILRFAPIVWKRIPIENNHIYVLFLYVLTLFCSYFLYHVFVRRLETHFCK